MTPTIDHARKFLDLCSFGLVSGLGKPEPGQMCIEAVWCKVLDLPHGDDPGCVGSEVRKFKIELNDKPWTSPQARAKGLKALGLAQIGSDQINQKEFRDLLWFRLGTKVQPLIWRYLATKDNKEARLTLAIKMESSKTLIECKAHAHAHAHAHDYAYDYDYGYGYAHAHDYAYAYDYDYGYDTWFSLVASIAVDVLRELKSPGCDWLYLIEETETKAKALPGASAP